MRGERTAGDGAVEGQGVLPAGGALPRDFCRVAFPVILSGGSWGVAQAVQTGVLGHLGSAAIAANAIANSLFQVASVAAFGMASVSAVLISKAVGGGGRERLRGYVNSL